MNKLKRAPFKFLWEDLPNSTPIANSVKSPQFRVNLNALVYTSAVKHKVKNVGQSLIFHFLLNFWLEIH